MGYVGILQILIKTIEKFRYQVKLGEESFLLESDNMSFLVRKEVQIL